MKYFGISTVVGAGETNCVYEDHELPIYTCALCFCGSCGGDVFQSTLSD